MERLLWHLLARRYDGFCEMHTVASVSGLYPHLGCELRSPAETHLHVKVVTTKERRRIEGETVGLMCGGICSVT